MTVSLESERSVRDDVSERVRDWVRPDEGRVLQRIYSDSEIFAAEIERIWKRTWLWAGHESEVPNAGDYVSRTVGTIPIIISRTNSGSISVNINVCLHRGNQICHLARGNTSVFRCAYHGWAYRNSGELVGVPYPKAYDDRSNPAGLRLPTPARVGNYRGLIFVSYSEDVPSIEDYLGAIAPEVDRMFQLSPVGKVRLDAGMNSVKLDCNWKLFQENGSDNYHSNFTHISGFTSEAQRQATAAISNDTSLAVVRLFENGHTQLDFRAQEKASGLVMRSGNAGATSLAEQEHFRLLVAALGEEAANKVLADSPPTLYVYPSLMVIQQDFRRVEPVSPTTSLLFQHPAMLEGVPDEINMQRLSRHEAAYGPAGFFLPDDLEIWERTQRTVGAIPDQWTNLTRGMSRERLSDGTVVSQVTDETGARGAWREYIKLMTTPASSRGEA